jgi:excisionase family DNA binding protein
VRYGRLRRAGRREPPEHWLTVADVCEQLQVTTDWVYWQVENRRISRTKVGKFLRFPRPTSMSL